eukprot:935354-Prorocentrum_minimum.AAC.1
MGVHKWGRGGRVQPGVPPFGLGDGGHLTCGQVAEGIPPSGLGDGGHFLFGALHCERHCHPRGALRARRAPLQRLHPPEMMT